MSDTEYTITCIIPGGSPPFLVDIEKTRMVDHLKDKIKLKLASKVRAFDAAELTLYRIKVDATNIEKAIDAVKHIAEDLSGYDELNPVLPLKELFPKCPLKMKIHILVVLPFAEPKTPPTIFQPDLPLEHSPVRPREELNDEIEGFLKKCRPAMKRLVKKAYEIPSLIKSWSPGPSVLADHVSGLHIPTIKGQPSLLLHDLGEEKDGTRKKLIEEIFSPTKHTVLINTSGSGKTRLLFEGLCHRWGFYFVADRDVTGLGSCDFEKIMRELDDAKGYAKARSQMGASLDLRFVKHIREVARGRLAQLLLARFLLLGLLIQEARKLERGLQQKEHRRLWVLLQVQPKLFGIDFTEDVFTDLTRLLRGVETSELSLRICTKRRELQPYLEAVLDPATGEVASPPFFCVLDEVQATIDPLSGRLGDFISESSKTKRPILREIWLFWSKEVLDEKMHLVLSGTGIEFQALEDTLSSIACKERGYKIVRDIEAQIKYIKRYLPAAWDQPQWKEFLDRAWGWLRGRYRYTATLVWLMLVGGYQCPHRTIDEYVKALTGFTPTDAEDWTNREPKLPSHVDIKSQVFTLNFQKMNFPQAAWLCNVIYSQILVGHYNPSGFNDRDREDFVEYGFARHDKNDTTVIDEPLAILAAGEWLNQNPKFSMFSRLNEDIGKHSPHRNGFEAYLSFYLRHIFTTAPALNQVFTFREDFAKCPDLAWQHEEFELVTVAGLANENDPEISVCTLSSGSSPNIGFATEDGNKALEWITTNNKRFTFCFPPKSFGPDLLFFVRSRRSKRILLVIIQAKKCSKEVKRVKRIEGVRTVTPSWFWRSKKAKYASADTAPFITNCRELATQTEDALAKILLSPSLKVKGADYPILRVLASWPGETRLEKDMSEDPDSHPLATLHLQNFNKVGNDLDRNWFLLRSVKEAGKELERNWFKGAVQQTLVVPSKRAREEQESEARPRKRAKKHTRTEA